MKTMKALVKAKGAEGLWLRDVPIPDVGNNDVLIKILKTSICGTDVHIWNWDAWAQRTIPVGTGYPYYHEYEMEPSRVPEREDPKPTLLEEAEKIIQARRELLQASKMESNNE